MSKEEFLHQDKALRHAIQTGVLYEQQHDQHAGFYRNNPTLANILKHIRTGLNCAMCEHATIVRLLVGKGFVTEAEYFEAALTTLREEVARYEKTLSEQCGASIKLG